MFPSPYGVSFILIVKLAFRLKNKESLEFPSPYGVSFILMYQKLTMKSGNVIEFPSPYGVSFILIDVSIINLSIN